MTTVSVAGIYHGLGVTHFCISLGCALKNKGYKVAIVEQNDSDDFRCLAEELNIFNEETEDGDYFSYRGIDYILYQERFIISSLRKENYDFVIIDYGINISDAFLNADYPVTVASSREWKRSHEKFYDICELLSDSLTEDGVTLAIPFATDNVKKEFLRFNKKYTYIFPSVELNPFTESNIDLTFLNLEQKEKNGLISSIATATSNVVANQKIKGLEKSLSEKENKLSEVHNILSSKEAEIERERAEKERKQAEMEKERAERERIEADYSAKIESQRAEMDAKRLELQRLEELATSKERELKQLEEEKSREIQSLEEKSKEKIALITEQKEAEIKSLEEETARKEQILSAKEEALKEEYYKARHDALTGYKNLQAFKEDVSKLDAYTLICFDINYLKKFNDNLGHKAGDELIKTVSGQIYERFNEVYRIGGDEFNAITDKSKDEVMEILADMDKVLEGMSTNPDYPYVVAYGVADTSEGDFESILKLADSRMYENKKSKKGMSEEEELMREATLMRQRAMQMKEELKQEEEALKKSEEEIEKRKEAVNEAIKDDNDPTCIAGTHHEKDDVVETDNRKYLTTMHFAKARVSVINNNSLVTANFYIFPTEYVRPMATTKNVVVCESDTGYEVVYTGNNEDGTTSADFTVDRVRFVVSSFFTRNPDAPFSVNILPSIKGEPVDIRNSGEQSIEFNNGMFTPEKFGKVLNDKELFPIQTNINGVCDTAILDKDGNVTICNGIYEDNGSSYRLTLSDKTFEVS